MRTTFLATLTRTGAAHSALACVVTMSAAMAAGPAAAQTMRAGQYEYTVTTEVMGMKIPTNFKQCVTQKDIDSNAAFASQQSAGSCSPAQVTRSGANIQMRYSCTQPKMSSEGTGTLRDDGFTMSVKTVQHEMGDAVINTQLSARRTGSC